MHSHPSIRFVWMRSWEEREGIENWVLRMRSEMFLRTVFIMCNIQAVLWLIVYEYNRNGGGFSIHSRACHSFDDSQQRENLHCTSWSRLLAMHSQLKYSSLHNLFGSRTYTLTPSAASDIRKELAKKKMHSSSGDKCEISVYECQFAY